MISRQESSSFFLPVPSKFSSCYLDRLTSCHSFSPHTLPKRAVAFFATVLNAPKPKGASTNITVILFVSFLFLFLYLLLFQIPTLVIAPSCDLIIPVLLIISFTIVAFFLMNKMSLTYPLELPEIRSRIARNLNLKDLASCTRVCQDWNDSFTSPLYHSVVMSKHGLSVESFERHKHLIRHLVIHSSVYGTLPSTSREQVVSSAMADSTLTELDLGSSSIRPDVA